MSAIQDIAILKAILQAIGAWDSDRYKCLRIQAVTVDHDAAGPAPWERYSY